MIFVIEFQSVSNTKVFLLFSVYTLISNSSNCVHVSGKEAYQCSRYKVESQSMCKDFCTSAQGLCVGYDYNHSCNKCYLYPSVTSCPSEFSPLTKSGPIAESMTDLRGRNTTLQNWVCYGKNLNGTLG